MIDSLKAYLRDVVRWLAPSEGLAERTVKSGIWATATNAGSRFLQILLLLILARLLSPADFGLMGIALLTVGGLQRFSELGFEAALIHREEADVDRYLNTAWCLQALRGVSLAVVVFLSAPYMASFFGEPRAADILQVMSIAPLLYDLRNPGVIYFKKSLEFHKEFVYETSQSLVNFFVAATYAFVRPTVWALVFGYIATNATSLLVSYLIHGYRPRLEFDLSFAKELIGYGKWITGNSILAFLFLQGDDAVVGWLLSATALGYYQLAYRLSNAPSTEITSVISTVMFPTYAQLQNDPDRLRSVFLKTLRIVTFISFPMAIGIIVVTPTFIRVFIGDNWLPMTAVMQILAIWGLMRAFASTSDPVWKAIGRPDYNTKLGVIKVVLMGLLIYPITMRYGVEGTAFLLIGTFLFPQWPIELRWVVNSTNVTYTRYFQTLAYPLSASLIMGLVVALARRYLNIQLTVKFFVLVVVGFVSYMLIVKALETWFEWEITQDIQDIISVVSS